MKSKIIIISILALSGAVIASASVNLEKVRPIETTPILARANEEGKTVMLTITIRSDGSVKKVIAESPDLYDELLAARVIQSVKDWTFEPAIDEAGRGQEVTVNLPIVITSVAQQETN